MSWLDRKLKRVLNKNTDAQIDEALAAIMAEISTEYQTRLDHNDLRVSDEDGEGILFGVRSNTARNPLTNALEVTCNDLTIARGREEAFSRALFNQKQIQIADSPLNLFSYEAPLLRKHERRGGNICKLDLVGLRQGAIWAIEYKQRYGAATSARYGVLESLAYGMLLARHLRDSPIGVESQVLRCLYQRGPYPGIPMDFCRHACAVKFSVAAPRAFFEVDTGEEPRITKTRQFTNAARRYANGFSQTLGIGLAFGGFLVIDNNMTGFSQRPVGGGMVVRTFNPPIVQAPIFNSIDDVYAYINQ